MSFLPEPLCNYIEKTHPKQKSFSLHAEEGH